MTTVIVVVMVVGFALLAYGALKLGWDAEKTERAAGEHYRRIGDRGGKT